MLKKEFSDTTGEDIISWAKWQMANYKALGFIEFVDTLLRTGSGKLMWRALPEREFGR